MAKHYNIRGNLTQDVLAVGSNTNISSVWITNTHASDAVTVDLYVEKQLSDKYYYTKTKSIAVSSYLQIENININTSSSGFGLYIKLNNADSEVSVILK